MLTGRCLCGEITYRVHGEPARPVACHCSQCRRQSGHLWASSYVPEERIEITGTPRWYRASATASRGFCATCGSVLFWKADAESIFSFSMGSLDDTGDMTLRGHIFTADKGAYYEIADGLPQD